MNDYYDGFVDGRTKSFCKNCGLKCISSDCECICHDLKRKQNYE